MTQEQKEKIVSLAKSLLGKPYKYGVRIEEAPDFFDCSSFTQYVFNQVGIKIPRSTIEQAAEGEEVQEENIEVGDLIFARSTHGHYNPRFPRGIGHVGIYIGDNKVVHASSRRSSEKPIVEGGSVIESTFNEYKERTKEITVIKRMG